MNDRRARAVGLIPARAGSSRVADKNVRLLGGHPMMAYTIVAATRSGVFERVVVSTDSNDYADIARHYGAEVPMLRPAEFAANDSPDVDWIRHVLGELSAAGDNYDVFSILRPTSPLRGAELIARAMDEFLADPDADSLRAVEPVSQHPGKMWTIDGDRLQPLMPGTLNGVPWHSSPTQYLPKVWIQNASLEIAWTKCVAERGSIAGDTIRAFVNPPPAGFDVNTMDDWMLLEQLVQREPDVLPALTQPRYPQTGTDDERSAN